MLHTVAIIGMGLIGGSVAQAMRQRTPQVKLIAIDGDAATLSAAQSAGFAGTYVAPCDALTEADLVIYAVPVEALAYVAALSAPFLKPGTVVTDVASVKLQAMEDIMATLPPHAIYVPGHPIAGSEARGFAAATPSLFEGKRVVLTPVDPKGDGVSTIAEFWAALGATIEYMPPDLHDRIYGAVSHLPQYLAFTLKRFYEEANIPLPESPMLTRFLRLTHSDKALWRSIFDANKANIDNFLRHFLEVMHQLRGELSEGEEEAQAAPDTVLVHGLLAPYLIASGLVSVVYRLERELDIPVARFAGTGFKDFTAPLEQNPEPVLEQVSLHAHEVVRAIDHFISLLAADTLH